MNTYKINTILLTLVISWSCNLQNNQTRQISSITPATSTCLKKAISILNASKFNKKITIDEAKVIEAQLYEKSFKYKKNILNIFSESNKDAIWKFRVKSANSIAEKSARQEDGKFWDGLGGMITFKENNLKAIDTFVEELVDAISSKKLILKRLRNYRDENGFTYLNDNHIKDIKAACKKAGYNIEYDSPINNVYVGTHFNLELPEQEIITEIQLKTNVAKEIGDIQHIVYAISNNKDLSYLKKLKNGEKISNLFRKLNPEEINTYNKYISSNLINIKKLHQYGGKLERGPPLPESIYNKFEEQLSIENIAKELELNHLYSQVTNQSQEEILYTSQYLYKNYSPIQLENIIGNAIASSKSKEKLFKFLNETKDLKKDLEGLNYVDIIPYKENEYLLKRRKTLHSGERWIVDHAYPTYQPNQKLGPDKVDIKDLHFMQSLANIDIRSPNSSKTSLVDLAKKIKSKEVSISEIPPLEVWRDTKGRIWSLDHRRLIAYALSNPKDKIPVNFVEKSKVIKDKFKYSNIDNGKSIIVLDKEKEIGIIIQN